jgi:putative PIN family toxin of toxin-antitoxin system
VRAVVDTNVLLSGLLWRGTPSLLLQRVRTGRLSLVSSPALIAELTEIIARPKFQPVLARSQTDPDQLLSELYRLAELIEPPPLRTPVSRDPDDDAVLALATAARSDLIISGDADLLTLLSHDGIPIVTPKDALDIVDRVAATR